jgi:hypothetical protein
MMMRSGSSAPVDNVLLRRAKTTAPGVPAKNNELEEMSSTGFQPPPPQLFAYCDALRHAFLEEQWRRPRDPPRAQATELGGV